MFSTGSLQYRRRRGKSGSGREHIVNKQDALAFDLTGAPYFECSLKIAVPSCCT
jgi:hypothetical protein